MEIYRKYIDISRIPQIYQQYYDLSEYGYVRKEVEEFISGGYDFFGWLPLGNNFVQCVFDDAFSTDTPQLWNQIATDVLINHRLDGEPPFLA